MKKINNNMGFHFILLFSIIILIFGCNEKITVESGKDLYIRNESNINSINKKIIGNIENSSSLYNFFNNLDTEYDDLLEVNSTVINAPKKIDNNLYSSITNNENNGRLIDLFKSSYNGNYILNNDVTMEELQVIGLYFKDEEITRSNFAFTDYPYRIMYDNGHYNKMKRQLRRLYINSEISNEGFEINQGVYSYKNESNLFWKNINVIIVRGEFPIDDRLILTEQIYKY